jgi:NAD-dependent SIR2 family protein deacetylase
VVNHENKMPKLRGEMGNSGRHVWVLGAGASAESAHTPLGRYLVWNYHVDCGLLVPYDNTGPDLREENENFTNYRKFLELAASIFPEFKSLPKEWDNRGMNVFHFYGRLDKRHYVDKLLELLQKQGNKEGAKLVKQLIFEHIAQASFNRPNTLYKRFVKEILKNKPPQTTSIISLNFDCLLHEDFDSQVYFDYLIDFDCIDTHRMEFYRRSNPIPLIKLNGSLDWGICENCGRLHLYYPFMYRTFYEGKVCANQQCGEIVTPFIVAPYDREKINSLWNVAKDHLKEADKVTVIGYSFPEYDEDVIKLFQDSLDTNVRIKVVDKCRDKKQIEYFKKRYMELFKRSIEVTLDGFSGYIDVQGKPT